jgi:hypothetical protein
MRASEIFIPLNLRVANRIAIFAQYGPGRSVTSGKIAKSEHLLKVLDKRLSVFIVR